MTDEQSPASFLTSHPRGISWLTIVLALLAVGTFIAVSNTNGRYYQVPMMGETDFASYDEFPPSMPRGIPIGDVVSNMPMSVQSRMDEGMRPDYYPYPTTNIPATDTRELLKVNYNASMQTRDVQKLTRHVETTVRGHGGRIDQISNSPKSGYVSFVVPMSKYEAFRTEFEGLVGSRFLTVDIQSQNMLPQKQSIEEQQTQADKTVSDYKAERQRLVNAHASAVKSLQSQIDADAQELARLRAQTPTQDIQVQIQIVSDDWLSRKAQLSDENAAYSWQLSDVDANIKFAQDWQTAIKTQDTALMDDIATVSGTVSVSWISLWEMAQLYLPGYWIPTIFAILAFLSYLSDRRRFGTV